MEAGRGANAPAGNETGSPKGQGPCHVHLGFVYWSLALWGRGNVGRGRQCQRGWGALCPPVQAKTCSLPTAPWPCSSWVRGPTVSGAPSLWPAAGPRRAPALSTRAAHVCASPSLLLSDLTPLLSCSLSDLFSEPEGLLLEIPFPVFTLDALVNTERGGWAGERPGPGASRALSPAVPRWVSPPQRRASFATCHHAHTCVYAHACARTRLPHSSMPSWGGEGGL